MQIVVLNVKFHLFQKLTDLFIAVIVSDKTNHKIQEMIDIPETTETQDIPETTETQDIPESTETQDNNSPESSHNEFRSRKPKNDKILKKTRQFLF